MDLALKRTVGGVVWTGLFGVALLWGGLRNAQVEARGVGYAMPAVVAPLEAGRLLELDVELHQQVDVADVVARLDPAPLMEEREIASAELLAMQEQAASVALTEARRFAQGLEGTLLDRARVSSRLLEDEAQQLALVERLAIEQDLLETGATSSYAVQDLQRELRVVEARIAAGRQALSVASAAASAATSRNGEAPGVNEWQVVSAAREVEALEGRLSRLHLRASIPGHVSAIYRNEGDVVSPGDAVLEITRDATAEVLAYVPVSLASNVKPGGGAHVVRATGEVLTGELVSVGGGPSQMPMQLWNNPAAPEWGVAVRIRIASGAVGPNEAVVVRL